MPHDRVLVQAIDEGRGDRCQALHPFAGRLQFEHVDAYDLFRPELGYSRRFLVEEDNLVSFVDDHNAGEHLVYEALGVFARLFQPLQRLLALAIEFDVDYCDRHLVREAEQQVDIVLRVCEVLRGSGDGDADHLAAGFQRHDHLGERALAAHVGGSRCGVRRHVVADRQLAGGEDLAQGALVGRHYETPYRLGKEAALCRYGQHLARLVRQEHRSDRGVRQGQHDLKYLVLSGTQE